MKDYKISEMQKICGEYLKNHEDITSERHMSCAGISCSNCDLELQYIREEPCILDILVEISEKSEKCEKIEKINRISHNKVEWSKIKIDTPIVITHKNGNKSIRHFSHYHKESDEVAYYAGGRSSVTHLGTKDVKSEYAKLIKFKKGE